MSKGLKTIESKQFAVPSLSPIYLVNNNSIVLHQLKETISKENKDMKFTYGTPNLQVEMYIQHNISYTLSFTMRLIKYQKNQKRDYYL